MNLAKMRSCFTVNAVKIFFVLSILFSSLYFSQVLAGGGAPPPPPRPPTLPSPATPTISPESGSHDGSVSVSISGSYVLKYTTNGATPTLASPTYSHPISLPFGTTTVKARAVRITTTNPWSGSRTNYNPWSGSRTNYNPWSGSRTTNPWSRPRTTYSWSGIATSSFTVTPPDMAAPSIAPDGGSFTDSVYVTITESESGSTIYYTTDGSDPSISSDQYTAPFALTNSTTIKAFATNPDFNNSPIAYSSVTVTPSGGGSGGIDGSGDGSGVGDLVGALPGEFSVNSSGAANYNIPIIAPVGTGGVVPKLSLNYSSNGRNGLLGLGWMIGGLSVIHRCPANLVKDGFIDGIDFDNNDRFCLDGQPLIAVDASGNRLAQQEPAYGAHGTEYRTEINNFSKIISYGSTGNGPRYFKVWTKSGEIMEYGNTNDSLINPPLENGITQPDAICWLLNKVSDTTSNYFTITYVEDISTGENFPQKIEYTGNATQGLTPYNSIEFGYEDRPDLGKRYLSGLLMNSTKRLKKVFTKSGSSVVKEYRLTYTNMGSTQVSRLASLDECDVNGDCVRPTTFEWQYGDESNFTHTSGINSSVTHAADAINSTKRIKYADINGDGITDIFYMMGSSGVTQACFGDQSGNFSSCSRTNINLIANDNGGHWSERIQFGDFNGDGKADAFFSDGFDAGIQGAFINSCWIVDGSCNNPFNRQSPPPDSFGTYSGVRLGNGDGTFAAEVQGPYPTTLKYRYNLVFGGLQTRSYNIFSQGPDKRVTILDLNGDGRSDVLLQSCNASNAALIRPLTPFGGSPATCQNYSGGAYVAYFSNGDGTFSSGSTIFFGPGSDIPRIRYGEFNGDGKTDVYVINGYRSATADTVYLSTDTNSYVTRTGPSTFIDGGSHRVRRDLNRFKFADLNGDGLTDLYYVNGLGNTVADSVYLSEGDGTFSSAIPTSFTTHVPNYRSGTTEPSSSYMDRINFGDFTGDGVTDVYYVTGTSASTDYIYPGMGDGTFGSAINGSDLFGSESVYHDSLDMARLSFADFNGDGITDIYRINGLSSTTQDTIRVSGAMKPFVKKFKNGFDVAIDVEYKPLTDDSVHEIGDCAGNSCYPNPDFQGQMYVVSATHTDTATAEGTDEQNTLTYFYEGLKVNARGYGILGFAKRTVTDVDTNIVIETNYKQQFPYIGQVESTSTTVDGILVSAEVNTFAASGNASTGPAFPYVSSSISKSYDVNGGALLSTVTTASSYDRYGNPTNIKVTTNDVGIDLYTTTTANTYTNDTSKWHLGRLTQAVVTKTGGAQASPLRASTFGYNAITGLLNMETIESGADALVKMYTHDAFGNRISVTESGAGISSRTTRTAYDAKGQFPVSVTNALGHKERREYNDLYGNVTRLKGPNNLSTYWEYDSLGRKIKEKRADGTETNIAYSFCNESCPSQVNGLASYKVTTTSTGAATSIAYYDAVNRVILTEVQSFDGSSVFVQTEYDAQGRVHRKSNPYFGTSTPYWTNYSYDDLGRVTQQSSPTTGTTSMSYNGFIASSTNDLGQTSTEMSNSIGQTLWTKDNNGKQLDFEYDAQGNLITVTDSAGNVTSNTYNLRGFKTQMIDPDMGTWRYNYNVLGELTSQTDAKNQTVSMTYDKLGRLKTRTEPEGTTTWTYDTATKGKGKLASVSHYGGYSRSHSYDDKGRPKSTTTVIGGSSYTVSLTYDNKGRLQDVVYPTGFGVRNIYNTHGYLNKVRNKANSSQVYWQGVAADQFGNMTTQHLGYGAGKVTTFRSYQQNSGRIQHIDSIVQDLEYTFNSIGNLTQRKDHDQSGLTENFTYDNLNRLKKAHVLTAGVVEFTYDDLGNIKTKSDVEAGAHYNYGAGNAGPHAITSVGSKTYTYDANGNQITGDGKTLIWSSFNKPTQIKKGSSQSNFTYGPDRARYLQVTTQSSTTTTTTYIDGLYEKVEKPGSTEQKHFIRAGSQTIAIYTDRNGTSNDKTEYLHRDHIGSIDTITDENGKIVEKLSFDAFGKRRLTQWNSGVPNIVSNNTRGFTGHEMLDAVGLIHMNGRVYDPVLGRFISADPTMQFPKNMQNYNRYSYVLNNPLSYTDPSGFFLSKLFKAFKKALQKIASVPILGAIVAIAAAAFGAYFVLAAYQGVGIGGAIVAGSITTTQAVVAGVVGGFAGGFVGSGGDLKAGLIGGLTGALTAGVGNAFQGVNTSFGSAGFFGKAVAHGVVQGASSAAQGGKFGNGFAAGAFTSGFERAIGKFETTAGKTIAASVVGGTSSEISGGKFANGAVSGAYVQLFNANSHNEGGGADPWWFGDSLPSGLVDFSGGLGDAILFGAGDNIRAFVNVDGGINRESGYYFAGEVASTVTGGVGVFRGVYTGSLKLVSFSTDLSLLHSASAIRNFAKRYAGPALYNADERAKIVSFSTHVANKGFDAAKAGLVRTRESYDKLIGLSPGIGGFFNDD